MTGTIRKSKADIINTKKNQTRKETYLAIKRGEITKYPCIMCGENKNIEAHHTSYNDYRHVIWLCYDCHVKLHRYLKVMDIEIPVDLATNSKDGREILRIGFPDKMPKTLNTEELKLQWTQLIKVFNDEITFAHLIINELLLCTCGEAPLKKSRTQFIKVVSEGIYFPEDLGYVIYLFLGGTDNIYYTPKKINIRHLKTAWNACIIDEHPTLMHLILNELLVCSGRREVIQFSGNKKYFVCSDWIESDSLMGGQISRLKITDGTDYFINSDDQLVNQMLHSKNEHSNED